LLHIATVHYRSPRWIEIQARYLRRHLSVRYLTWASIEGIDPAYGRFFDNVLEQRGVHAGKLNHLALEICHAAADDDLIMFLDGDAFPITDPMPVLGEDLEKAPLAAVRRAENLDEPQPHPSFCVTTVGTWRRLPGDWSVGPVWNMVNGRRRSDTGATLMRTLELTNTPWVQLLRTNGSALHPLFFGIYGDVVYHHGAGFRENELPHVDRRALKARANELRVTNPARRVLDAAADRIGVGPWSKTVKRNSEQSRLIFEAIQRDDPDWVTQIKHDLAPAAQA
jgi:hypothetical protein